MVGHVVDDDLPAGLHHRVGQPIAARDGDGFVANPVHIKRGAELQFTALIQKDMHPHRIADQPHRFRHHGVEHFLQVKARGQVEADAFQCIQLICLVFDRRDQGML